MHLRTGYVPPEALFCWTEPDFASYINSGGFVKPKLSALGATGIDDRDDRSGRERYKNDKNLWYFFKNIYTSIKFSASCAAGDFHILIWMTFMAGGKTWPGWRCFWRDGWKTRVFLGWRKPGGIGPDSCDAIHIGVGGMLPPGYDTNKYNMIYHPKNWN